MVDQPAERRNRRSNAEVQPAPDQRRRDALDRADDLIVAALAVMDEVPATALERSKAALAALAGTDDAARLAKAMRAAGMATYRLGEPLEAMTFLIPALEHARTAGDTDLQGSCLSIQSGCFRSFGDFEGAQACTAELLQLSHANGNTRRELTALLNTAVLHQDLGETDEALAIYERLRRRPFEDIESLALLLNNIGASKAETGRHAEALADYDESIELIRRHEVPHLEPRVLGNWGVSKAAAGDASAGIAALRSALALARAIPSATDELQALRKLGETTLAAGSAEEAIEHLAAARALAERVGSAHDIHDTLGPLADAYGRAGQPLLQLSTCLDLLALERKLYREKSDRRARSMMLRIGLLQSRHEADMHAVRNLELRDANEKLAKANESLRIAMRALGIDVDQKRQAAGRAEEKLSVRELTVLKLVAKGMTNAEIGASLALSPLTIRHHVSVVLRKLGVGSRTQAIAVGLRDGLL